MSLRCILKNAHEFNRGMNWPFAFSFLSLLLKAAARTKPLSPKFIEKLVLGCSENIRSEHKTRSENKTLKGGGARLLDLETQMEIFEPIGDEAEGPPCDGCKSGPQESHEVVGGCQRKKTIESIIHEVNSGRCTNEQLEAACLALGLVKVWPSSIRN